MQDARPHAPPIAPSVFAAMVTASMLWGSLPIASKAVVEQVSPAQQTLVRALSAFVVLTLFTLVMAGRAPLRAAMRRPLDLVIQGFLSFYASSLTSLMALQYISASLQAVLVASYPVMLGLLAVVEEGRVTGRWILGTAIALAGIVAVVGGDDPRAIFAGHIDPRGVGLALLTALIIAGSQRWGQRQVRLGDPLGTTALAAGAALPFLFVQLALGEGVDGIASASLPVAMLLLYLGVFCTAINFGLWFWALKMVTAARAAPIQYLATPASVLLAWHFLGEPLTVGLFVGGALVIGGVALTQSARRARIKAS